ncbi:hypothetical protein AJ87_08115 [Rhizobium yanglingense]|nr:hypothetical protein AJ87_08115 [Rhizobium yanglingense]
MNAIADRYDGLILDQWGVLHNGTRPYDGVVEALETLRERKVPVAILTNSSKGEQANATACSTGHCGDPIRSPHQHGGPTKGALGG